MRLTEQVSLYLSPLSLISEFLSSCQVCALFSHLGFQIDQRQSRIGRLQLQIDFDSLLTGQVQSSSFEAGFQAAKPAADPNSTLIVVDLGTHPACFLSVSQAQCL